MSLNPRGFCGQAGSVLHLSPRGAVRKLAPSLGLDSHTGPLPTSAAGAEGDTGLAEPKAPHWPRPGSQPAANIRSSIGRLVLEPDGNAGPRGPIQSRRSAQRRRGAWSAALQRAGALPTLRFSRPRTGRLPGSVMTITSLPAWLPNNQTVWQQFLCWSWRGDSLPIPVCPRGAQLVRDAGALWAALRTDEGEHRWAAVAPSGVGIISRTSI